MENSQAIPSWRREISFISIIVIFCFSYVTFIFEAFPTVTYFFKIAPLIPMILVFPKWSPDSDRLRFILIYVLLIIYGYMLVFKAEDFFYSLSFTSKYFLRLFFFFLLLLSMRSEVMTDRLVKVFMWAGVLWSLQGFIAWLLVYNGMTPVAIRSTNEGLDVIWSPMWGNIGGTLNGIVLRVASYFREASLFGNYLEYCFWISFGYACCLRSKKYAFLSAILFLGIFSTFSIASFVSMMVSVMVLVSVRFFNREKPIQSIAKAFLVGLLMFVFVSKKFEQMSQEYVSAYRQGRLANQQSVGDLGVMMMAFGRYSDPRVEAGGAGRVGLIQKTISIFNRDPFGIGIIDPKASRLVGLNNVSATAPVMWLVWVGAPGLMLIIFVVLMGIFTGLRKLKDPQDMRGYLGLALLTQTIHHLVYGTWMDPFYLFILACVVVTQKSYFIMTEKPRSKWIGE